MSPNMAFTAHDWQHVTSRMAWVEDRMRAKRLTVETPQFLPPVSVSQVDAFSRSTGLSLPGDLVDLVTKFAGGWRFYWSLCVEAEDRWLNPIGFVGHSGGNGEVPFLGATPETTLLNLYNDFQRLIGRTVVADPQYPEFASTRKVIRSLFPLQSSEGGYADFTVIRLDTSPSEIHFLDHAECYQISSGSIIGRGLTDFLHRWAAVGFPSCDGVASYLTKTNGCIDVQAGTVQQWLQWLGDESQ